MIFNHNKLYVFRVITFVCICTLFLQVFSGPGFQIEIEAKEKKLPTPEFTISKIDKGTGIKITIEKTKGATGYHIYITNRVNAYSPYSKNDGAYSRKVATIEKNGKKVRTLTLTGLPEGKYTFRIVAFRKTLNKDPKYSTDKYTFIHSDVTKEKKVKIRAAKLKERKDREYEFSNVNVGDTVVFGAYEQDAVNINGKEDIEWIVLSKENGRMLLLSKYALDSLSYNKDYVDITWENCTLRKWLNEVFYKEAFTDRERNMICNVKLKNPDDTNHGVSGGNDTEDNVFLLCSDDIVNTSYGFGSDCETMDKTRFCAATPFATLQGVLPDNEYNEDFVAFDEIFPQHVTDEGLPTCMWWLRSPELLSNGAAMIEFHGIKTSVRVHDQRGGVRPAIYVSIS